MGIPSYFSYIIRNHPHILRNIEFLKKNVQFQHLYMDCNSIIYDTVSMLEKIVPKMNIVDFETRLIQIVMDKIDEYIFYIKPSDTVYIAFDGVAPPAKWQQQQSRRERTTFMSTLRYGDETIESIPIFDKIKITPGTEFMKTLSLRVESYYRNSHERYGVKKVIISSPNEDGEGEHKIFEYVREHNGENLNDQAALYGLDSDLIMLSIFHLKYIKNIHIFREAPEFMRSSIPVDIKFGSNEPYFLDMSSLSQSILTEMRCKYTSDNRIDDYVFLCFFLGNDFLPHFPFLNIRTHGLQVLLDMYRIHVGSYPDRFFILNDTIQWDVVFLFIKEIAKIEHELLLREHGYREKYDKWVFSENTAKEREENVQNIPIIYRAVEKYICPTEPYWKERYYKALFFDMETLSKEEQKKQIDNLSANYIEGLEWVYTYYTKGCKDWLWKSRSKNGLMWSSIGSVERVWKCELCKKKVIVYVRYIWEL